MASLWESILSNVQSVAAAAVPAFTVVVRKQLRVWPSDAPPLVLVCPGADRDVEEAFSNALLREYQVFLVMILAGNQQFESAGIPAMADPKSALALALHKPALAGVSAVYDVTYTAHPLFEITGAKANWDVSALELGFRTSEALHA